MVIPSRPDEECVNNEDLERSNGGRIDLIVLDAIMFKEKEMACIARDSKAGPAGKDRSMKMMNEDDEDEKTVL